MRGRLAAGLLCAWLILSGQANAQDAAAGEKVFARCRACHVADAPTNRVGPSLMKLSGRVAGTLPGYTFSPVLVEAGQAGLVWDEATLATYLRNPKAMLKGTRMAFVGLKNEDDIVNVIAYINQFR